MRVILLVLALIFICLIVFIMVHSLSVPKDSKTMELEFDKEEIKVGLISDTHIPTRANRIPEKVFETFKDVDFIIHSGDFVDLSVKEELEELAPVYGVQGNMDPVEVREVFPKILIIRLFDHKIGVYHGSLNPWRLKRVAEEYDLDALVSGHTHRSGVKKNKIIYVNPGSPTNPIFSKKSYGSLKITRDSIEPEIVYV